jgi:hypothetical protein
MKRTLAIFETTVMMVLVALMALAIAAATLDLVWVFATGLLSAPFDFLTVNELLDVFGLFLVVR